MTVKLQRKSDGEVVEAMFFDGTQTGAVGISAWAGSEGVTVNMAYRGGDSADYVLVFPEMLNDDPPVAHGGDWVVMGEDLFEPVSGQVVSEDYDAVTEGELL